MNAPAPVTLVWVAAAVIGGTLGTMLMRALALRIGFVNHPNPLIPQHTRAIAYMGGIGVAIGIACGLATLAALGGVPPDWRLLLPAALFLALGVADDRVALGAGQKFGLQAVIAALAVALGAGAPLTGVPAIDAAASWLVMVVLVNAFNLTDVCDGLLASLGMVMFVALALLDARHAGSSIAIAAACLGFLFLNRPPARIFLGDAGSHLLGYLAAALSLQAARGVGAPLPVMAAALAITGVPLFELVFLVVVRMRRGLPWWKGSPDHFSLRLQAAGFSRGRTDLIACAVAAAWAACGLRLPGSGALAATVLMVAMAAGAAGAAAYLLRHPVAPRPVSHSLSPSHGVPARDLPVAS